MALTNKLSAIGDAIREKTGKTELLTLDAMPLEIASIETGGGGEELPEEAFVITGETRYMFSSDKWNWFIEKYGNKIRTEELTNPTYMFPFNRKLKKIPFEINLRTIENTHVPTSDMFYQSNGLEEAPIIKGNVSGRQYMFYECSNLKRLPEDYWQYMVYPTASYSSFGNQSYMFYGCRHLRNFPTNNFVPKELNESSNSYTYYYQGFRNCNSIDELKDLPVPYTKNNITSNCFYNTFDECNRLKKLTFELNDDGSPIIVKWKNQTISLNGTIGYGNYKSYVLTDKITEDKEIKDDATYQVLKNDPDCFTLKADYARYNHNSAVETINTLPDTSAYLATAGGTNTIKFKGVAGALTDGGAINTLTAEEIAVATAKGWTVSLS